MPLIHENIWDNQELVSVWKITESEEELEEFANNKAPVQLISSLKKQQWLASRGLLRKSLDDLFSVKNAQVEKTISGNPFLVDHNMQISISHSAEYAAVRLSANKQVGIDIEKYHKKVMNVKHKFLNEIEKECFDTDDEKMVMQIWCAKECVFKWYGKGEVSFQNHIQIFKDTSSSFLKANFTKEETPQNILMRQLNLDNEEICLLYTL